MDRKLRRVVNLLFLTIVFAGNLLAQFAHFITRHGDQLLDGDRVYRFISFNTPNLHYVEDYLPFDGTNPWRLPDEFEIRDALSTVKQMGGKVTRMYVLSVRRSDDTPDIRRHVDGPGLFNVDAFETLDKVLEEANTIGVRVIIPFVDNWKWWGGVAEYAAFRGKERDQFWTDPQLRSDFKKTIEFVINRTNTWTGVKYRDDKAILAWETGNELVAPFSWTKEMATYIKSLDSNHLVLEGTLAKELVPEEITDPDLDILATHHYGDPKASLRYISANRAMAKGKKPYLIGEYGIIPTRDIEAITDTIIHQGITGGMLWSMRFRRREGGFYYHYEYNNISSYRWPGFSNGNFYDEQAVLDMMRRKAYEIDGLTEPPLPVPEAPRLLTTDDISSISWQGSVGARTYIVERKDADSTGWRVIADDVDESKRQYRPLFSDESAVMGRAYFYRIKARNESGSSDYSNLIGPIGVTSKTIVDEMDSFDKVYQKGGNLRLLTYEDIRKAKEDRSRLTGADGSYIVYQVPEGVTSVKVDAFKVTKSSALYLGADSVLGAFRALPVMTRDFTFGSNDYGFFDAVLYISDEVPATTKFIRIELSGDIQIARVEISYSSQTHPILK